MLYKVIYADPPWHFRTYSAKGTGRGAVSHYDCLSFDQIASFPIKEYAEKDCALFLWATDPMLDKAFDLIKAWGFTFKTVGFYWVKVNRSADMSSLSEKDFFTGLGYWSRANPEQCLLATRGQPLRKARDVQRLVLAKRREHSRKPDQVYDRIERLVDGPYLELFARATRQGWDSLGDQKELFDKGTVTTRRQPSSLKDIVHNNLLKER